jgi:PRTRC genetic system protein A
MFKIFINDGQQPPPQDNIYYIIAKNGIFLKKTFDLVHSIIKVDQISILNDITEQARLNVPKIPKIVFSKVINFCKDIYNKYHAEAVILLYYNSKRKWYKLYIPNQQVSGGAVSYQNLKTIPNYQLIGTIHSHGSMSAWHSYVDDRDEQHFDGLHITVGHIDQPMFDISSSIVINGKRFIVDAGEYIDGIIRKSLPTPTNAEKKYKYQIDSSLTHPYNKKWLRKINKKVKYVPSSIIPSYDLSAFLGDEDGNESSSTHPCFGCEVFHHGKKRFEEDLIKAYNLEEFVLDNDLDDLETQTDPSKDFFTTVKTNEES